MAVSQIDWWAMKVPCKGRMEGRAVEQLPQTKSSQSRMPVLRRQGQEASEGGGYIKQSCD
jgi:hypothetical protein